MLLLQVSCRTVQPVFVLYLSVYIFCSLSFVSQSLIVLAQTSLRNCVLSALWPWIQKLLLGLCIVTSHYQREAEAAESIWCCGEHAELGRIDNKDIWRAQSTERIWRLPHTLRNASTFGVCVCVCDVPTFFNANQLTYTLPDLNLYKETIHSHT